MPFPEKKTGRKRRVRLAFRGREDKERGDRQLSCHGRKKEHGSKR